ncbi:GNAT family N-acetyltransferase [Microbacterium sp. MMO-10]|uniref:GNAT family N-acetyltransferase n=1 Tax=Microbacterium sp. MMO-10 TaxID=3081272 RepID=UPI0030168D5A
MATVAECERVQTAWFRARAEALGGECLVEDGLVWTDGPDGMNLLFPEAPTVDALRRGVARAEQRGRGIVGVWLGTEVDETPLAEAGFERGWAPCWMSATLAETPVDDDARIALIRVPGSLAGGFEQERLALARIEPAIAWCAVARDAESERFAGRAWSFRSGDLAGVFDMAVWPAFRRRGLGTGLLAAVCAAAARSGAREAVLNATPEGELLYSRCGFTRVGTGITWWRHLAEG